MSPCKTFIPFKSDRQVLLADAQLGDDRAVTLDVLLRQIVQQTAALTDHLVHAQTAVVVVGMLLEMLGQLADALGEDRDLDLGRAGVALVGGVVADDLGLDFFGDQACFLLSISCYTLRPGHGAERTPHRRHDPIA